MGILSSNPKNIPEKVQDLISLYAEMVKTRRKIETAKGDMSHERLRHDKLEFKINPIWSELSNTDQMIAVSQLVKDGFMNEDCAKILIILAARIDMMPPPEPCFKIGPIKK